MATSLAISSSGTPASLISETNECRSSRGVYFSASRPAVRHIAL